MVLTLTAVIEKMEFHVQIVRKIALVVKNQPAGVGDRREVDLIPESGRSCGGGHGSPLLQYSCLENPMDRSMKGYSSQGSKESDMSGVAQHTRTQKSGKGITLKKERCGNVDEDEKVEAKALQLEHTFMLNLCELFLRL